MKLSTPLRAFVFAATLSITASAITSAFMPSVALAADDKADKEKKVSEKVGKPLKAAMEAVQKKQFDVAMEKIKEADAVPKKTPFEQFKVNEILAYLYGNEKKYPELITIYEKFLEAPQYLAPEQSAVLVKQIATLYYQLQQFPKFNEYAKRWLKDHPNDTEIQALLGQSYYAQKDFKQSREQMNSAIATVEKAGQEPKETWLRISQSSAVELGDDAGVIASYEKLVRYYPKADYWQGLLDRVSRNEKSDRAMFQWFRLMNDVGAMKQPDQYKEYAQLAMTDFAMPGEAVRVLESGLSKQVLGTEAKDKERFQRTLAKAKELAQTDKAQLPQLEKEAQASTANGGADVGIGLAYFSYEQYDQAIPALERGIKKGGLKNPDDAKLTLGIAQYKKGQKEQARNTFKAIPADSALNKVASMWVLRTYS